MAWKKLLADGDPVTDLTGTAYRLLLIDSAGDVIELTHGTANKVLTSGGASADPTWEAPASGAHALDAGQSDVTITTPVDDEVLSYESGTWINKTAAEAGLAVISHGTHLTEDSVGATEVDEAATDIAFAQIVLTPAASGTGTTEGTVYYSSADDHLYVYVAA
jgi:hypothetical protein